MMATSGVVAFSQASLLEKPEPWWPRPFGAMPETWRYDPAEVARKRAEEEARKKAEEKKDEDSPEGKEGEKKDEDKKKPEKPEKKKDG